ncbi:MAG: hypothetical protein RJB38_221 [Pseudomonadota bacterium]|jgi:type IV pilus assembly protein PilM
MRIVGIDWGTSSIKAVEIDSAFGRYEIHDYRELELSEDLSAHEAAAQLIASLSQRPSKIVVAMRSSQITTRNLHLPTRDKKAIQSGVTFQLEDELPFSIDEMAHDSSILSQSGQQSDVHVATTMKKHLAAELQKWSEVGVDPDIITTEGWALRTLVNRTFSPAAQDKPILLVYMGAKSTLLYIHWRGFPMICREYRWGGDSLRRQLVDTLHLSVEQAERVKRNPVVLQETQKLSLVELVSDGLDEILREIKHMDLACKALTHENLSAIYLTGGGSLIEGLPEILEKRIGIAVERIRPLSSLSPSGVTFAESSDAKMGLAAALAMTLVGSDKNLVINLRRDEFARSTKGREIQLQNLKKPLLATGLVAASFALSMTVQTSLLKKQLEDQESQLRRSLNSFFGSVSTGAMRTYLANPATLKNAIQRELDKSRELARLLGPNPSSPHQYLKNLSSSFSKTPQVDLLTYQVGAAAQANVTGDEPVEVRMTFLTSDPEGVSKLSAQLIPGFIQSSSPAIEEVPASVKEPRKFKITFAGTANPGGFRFE